jgi:nucleotide-binding universal stress UspA family protein
MNGPILVGVDDSTASQHAVRWAAELARTLGSEVVAVHAVGLLEGAAEHAADHGPLQARVEEWCAPVVAAGCPHRVIVRDGSALDALLETAPAERARLVVVGSRAGAGGDPARTLGSTSLHLLQAANVPVLVIPDPEGPTDAPLLAGAHILVGVDRSAPSLAALGLAADLAEVGGGRVTALEVVEPVPPFPPGPSPGLPAPREWTTFEQALDELRRRGVRVQPVVRTGSPVATILDVADGLRVDLVVMGTRGRHGPDDMTLGSVARSVADRARRPTLVVPADAGPVHLRARP